MTFKLFEPAFNALPQEEVDGEDIRYFLGAVALAFMPPEEALRTLLEAAQYVAEYSTIAEERLANGENTCTCPRCTAAREAQTKH